MEYYNEDAPTTQYVNFKLLGEDGRLITHLEDESCFSHVTYRIISKDVALIRVYHPKNQVPYNLPEIRRWIADINEMGFPCSFAENITDDVKKQNQFIAESVCADVTEIAKQLMRHGEEAEDNSEASHHFDVRLKDFKHKSHFVSTLMLVRCLIESGICKVPDIYFKMMDANPGADKFDVMQTAHKELKDTRNGDGYDDYSDGHNTNHMITCDGNGSNVKRDVLLARYAKDDCNVYEHKRYNLGQSEKWNGDL